MKRPIFKDYKPEEINCAEDMSNWYQEYAKAMEKYADCLEAESLVKESDSLPCVSARTEMRKQAITVFELTKGFTGEPTDNAMKTALEMADYVMRLTNDL